MIISHNNNPCSTRNKIYENLDFLFVLCWNLLKPGTTWNDLQRVRNDMKHFAKLHFFHSAYGCSHSGIASRRIMVKKECQASIIMGQASIIMCIFFTGYRIYLFLSGFRVSREREPILVALVFHFHPLRKSFDLQRLHLSERFNDEQGLFKRIQEPY